MHFRLEFNIAWLAIFALSSATEAAQPPITAISFAPDGKSVLVGSQAGVEVRNWPGLEVRRTWQVGVANVHDIEFSLDGSRVAVAGGAPADEGVVEIRTWPGGKLTATLGDHEDLVYAAAWSSDSRRLATASLDRHVLLWNVKDSQVKRRFSGHSRGVTAIGILPGEQILISAGIDQSVRVWNLDDGKLIRTLNNHTQTVNDLAVRTGHDGLPMIATVSNDRTIRFWQPTIGRMVRFVRIKSAPLAVAWIPNTSLVAVTAEDGRARIIDADTAAIVQETSVFDGWAYSLAVHPDGKDLLAGGREGQLKRVSRKVE